MTEPSAKRRHTSVEQAGGVAPLRAYIDNLYQVLPSLVGIELSFTDIDIKVRTTGFQPKYDAPPGEYLMGSMGEEYLHLILNLRVDYERDVYTVIDFQCLSKVHGKGT